MKQLFVTFVALLYRRSTRPGPQPNRLQRSTKISVHDVEGGGRSSSARTVADVKPTADQFGMHVILRLPAEGSASCDGERSRGTNASEGLQLAGVRPVTRVHASWRV
jgi:hypothetical protein